MKLLYILILVALSLTSYATTSGDGKITQFYTSASHNFVRIEFSQPIKQLDCEAADFYIAELDDTQKSSRFYSALLAAYMAQKDVSFWISSCTEGTYWGKTRPKIFDIYMER